MRYEFMTITKFNLMDLTQKKCQNNRTEVTVAQPKIDSKASGKNKSSENKMKRKLRISEQYFSRRKDDNFLLHDK